MRVPIFLGRSGPGANVIWALGTIVTSAISLDLVLVFGDWALHLPHWGYILLLLLSTSVFVLSLLVLGAHQQQHQQDTFQILLVLLTPALSILFHICLMRRLNYLPVCASPSGCRLVIAIPAVLVVYFWWSYMNMAQEGEPAGAATAGRCTLAFPKGSLEETVQVVQPPSQALAQEPSCMEQPTSP